jgi:hypothetical protein
MFWRNKISCPISKEDKEWLEDSFLWLEDEFGSSIIKERPITLPTKEYWDKPFSGNENDAFYVLDYVREGMFINREVNIDLVFYSEQQPVEFSEGIVSVQDENIELTAGRYIQYDKNDIEILIEKNQLKNPIALIATIAHELAHYKLLGEGRLKDNDEPLTDLTTLIFGFGIFTANTSVVKMQTWSGTSHAGWQIHGGSGYLNFKQHGFALALYSSYRNENRPEWINFLEKDVSKEYSKSIKYIEAFPDQIRFKPAG